MQEFHKPPTPQPAGRTMWHQPCHGLMGDAVQGCTTQQKMKLLLRLHLPRILDLQLTTFSEDSDSQNPRNSKTTFKLGSWECKSFKMEYQKNTCSHTCLCVSHLNQCTSILELCDTASMRQCLRFVRRDWARGVFLLFSSSNRVVFGCSAAATQPGRLADTETLAESLGRKVLGAFKVNEDTLRFVW